jgi:integrase
LAPVEFYKSTEAVCITLGLVFFGLFKGGKMRPSQLSLRAIEYIVGSYPVAINGKIVNVKPHDLRRTYARRLYEAGVDIMAIQQNLGHANLKTTEGYIGTLDADTRRAPAVYSFDLGMLWESLGKDDSFKTIVSK